MAGMTELQKLQKLIPQETDTTLLQLLLDDAEEFILAYTCRTQLPTGLTKTKRDLAVIAYNRLGTEGESSRSEAGESYSFNDAPASIYNVLNRYRLLKAGGTYANEAQQTD